MDIHYFRRRYRTSGDPEESPRSIFWSLGILVCLTSLVPTPPLPTAANSCQRCWITAYYPAEQIFLEYMLVSTVHKRRNMLLISMSTALPSFARRSGRPRCLALFFTSLSFFASEGTSSRTPRENGPFDGSHVARAGDSRLQEIILIRAPSNWPRSSCGTTLIRILYDTSRRPSLIQSHPFPGIPYVLRPLQLSRRVR
jgi:hypothetical protein